MDDERRPIRAPARRQPRRDRPPRHPNRPRPRHPHRGCLLASPTGWRCTCARPTPPCRSGGAPAPSRTSTRARCWRRPPGPAPTPCTRDTASCPRTPRSPRPWCPPASCGWARRPSRSARWPSRSRPSASSVPREYRSCPAPSVAADDPVDDLAAAGAAVGYPLLVKAVAGGGGKGMRLVERGRRARRGEWQPRGARPRRRSATGRSSSSGTCTARGTSRCRCSATATGTWCTSSSASARSSAGTRRWWRRRPRPASP